MSLTFIQRHDDLMCVLAVSVVIGLGIVLLVPLLQWNDEQWFRTLDKLACEEIWEMMMNGNPDWDTLEYYGDRC